MTPGYVVRVTGLRRSRCSRPNILNLSSFRGELQPRPGFVCRAAQVAEGVEAAEAAPPGQRRPDDEQEPPPVPHPRPQETGSSQFYP